MLSPAGCARGEGCCLHVGHPDSRLVPLQRHLCSCSSLTGRASCLAVSNPRLLGQLSRPMYPSMAPQGRPGSRPRAWLQGPGSMALIRHTLRAREAVEPAGRP